MCVPSSVSAAVFLLAFSCDTALFLRPSSSGLLAGDFESAFFSEDTSDFFASLFLTALTTSFSFAGFSVFLEGGGGGCFFPSPSFDPAAATFTIFPSALDLSSSGRGSDLGLGTRTRM